VSWFPHPMLFCLFCTHGGSHRAGLPTLPTTAKVSRACQPPCQTPSQHTTGLPVLTQQNPLLERAEALVGWLVQPPGGARSTKWTECGGQRPECSRPWQIFQVTLDKSQSLSGHHAVTLHLALKQGLWGQMGPPVSLNVSNSQLLRHC
jgi:hypothetical protein